MGVAFPGDLGATFSATDGAVTSGGQTFYARGTRIAVVGADGRPRRMREISGLRGGIASLVTDGAGGVIVAAVSEFNSFTFLTTVVRFNAALDVVWSRSYSPGSYTGVRLVPGDGQHVVVLVNYWAMPLAVATGDPVAPVAYRQQGIGWTGGRVDAAGYTLVGEYSGALLAARHRWTGEREWYRASAPGIRSTDVLVLGSAAPAPGGELLVPYQYFDYSTPNAGVVRLRADGTVAANWQPTFVTTRNGSRVRAAADGTLYQTVTVEENGSTYMYPIGPDGSRASGPMYSQAVVPQADGGYLYAGPSSLRRGAAAGCTPGQTLPFTIGVNPGGRSFVLAEQTNAPTDPLAVTTSTPTSVTVADVSLAEVPAPTPEATGCARLGG